MVMSESEERTIMLEDEIDRLRAESERLRKMIGDKIDQEVVEINHELVRMRCERNMIQKDADRFCAENVELRKEIIAKDTVIQDQENEINNLRAENERQATWETQCKNQLAVLIAENNRLQADNEALDNALMRYALGPPDRAELERLRARVTELEKAALDRILDKPPVVP
jgi:uncharacterized coiled-coil DUF342 family protein